MISKAHFVNKLRELGFTFKTQAKRVDIWRLKGGTQYVSVRRKKKLSEAWVILTLRNLGVCADEIQEFIKSSKI